MTANQQYKEYKKGGGTLSFNEWITREKKKKFLNVDGQANVAQNKPLSDSISQTLNKMYKEAGLKTEAENKYVFGIHRNIWLGAGVLIAVIAGVSIYKQVKNG